MNDTLKTLAELGLGSRLNRLSGQLMKEIQLVYAAKGIDFDPYLFPIFKIIIDSEMVTTSHIQGGLRYSQPAITQALQKLMQKDLVAFKSDRTDKRKKLYYLTERGKEVHQKMLPLWKAMDTQVKELTHFPSSSLLDHISQLEASLAERELSKRILENIKE
ncbi:hypothetical protein WIW50_01310 [Flavobacteriaceae bacterium 3-367]|uniref:MarR family winged helix-turn-helix transcriptional regulator n=1 Tax=Eudoraea algarum TaxID=3417568 RepID=UPI00328528B8